MGKHYVPGQIIRDTGPDDQDIRPALRRLGVQFTVLRKGALEIWPPKGLTITFPADGRNPQIVDQNDYRTVLLTVCYPTKQ
jgi:hypothetical protein